MSWLSTLLWKLKGRPPLLPVVIWRKVEWVDLLPFEPYGRQFIYYEMLRISGKGSE